MKKLLAILVILAILIGLGYLFRVPLRDTAEAMLTRDMFVPASAATFSLGPKPGSRFPGVRATFEGREVKLIDEFAGPNGVIFVALRSVDWCPYCKRQLLELQENRALFDANGIGLVAITYDAPELQSAFAARHAVDIPLFSDIDALTFKTLGILNEDYQPGDDNYGIPHPGMIIVNDRGVVVGKLFVEEYSLRVNSRDSLAFAKDALRLESPFSAKK